MYGYILRRKIPRTNFGIPEENRVESTADPRQPFGRTKVMYGLYQVIDSTNTKVVDHTYATEQGAKEYFGRFYHKELKSGEYLIQFVVSINYDL
jgi:hypothetical protein